MNQSKATYRLGFSLLIALLTLLLFRFCARTEVGKIEMTTDGLIIGNKLYPSFSDLSDPESHWGKARTVDGEINDLLIWDKKGVCLFRQADTPHVVSLHLAMVPSGEKNRPQNAYNEVFTVNKVTLNVKMPVSALQKAGFTPLADSGWYKLTLGKYRLSAFTESDELKTLELAPVD